MALDPLLRPFVDYLQGDLPQQSIAEERAQGLANAEAQAGTLIEPAPDNVQITTLWLPGPDGAPPVMVKTYRTVSPGALRPGLLYIHGGGWSTGSADSAESHAWCGQLAAGADLVVVSVEYRLAPEHQFPAGFDDCYDALTWVAANADLLGIDPGRLAVGGGSAGGNLSAALTLKARDEAGPAIALQILEAPALDLTLGSSSIHEYDAAYPAVGQMALGLPERYLARPEDATNPYASPLLAADLSGLPLAAILACEVDPVREDAVRYAARLQEAGVPTTFTIYEGLLHGTWSLTLLLPQARAWRDDCIAALRTL
jgi:acetyl esterase